jgi:hypothetical protein
MGDLTMIQTIICFLTGHNYLEIGIKNDFKLYQCSKCNKIYKSIFKIENR